MNDAKPPGIDADEKTTLRGFLDYLRHSVTTKVDGVPEPQVRTPGVPSGTSLLGLLKHLTAVERFYFLGEGVRSWAATMKPTVTDTADEALARYRATIAEANEVIEACSNLGDLAPQAPGRKSAPTMRWVLVHMIEETGRHAGHMDILREQIDGATGR